MFSDTAIQLQPVFSQLKQNNHALAPGVTTPGATTNTSLTWGGGDLVAVGGKVALLPIPLGTVDFFEHHIHAFTIHVTAFSLMFLFSRRGYWQELIESIVWAHNKLKVAPATQPRALSIIQGPTVGVTHYLLGGIATTWAFFLARIIAVG
ncbi:hypothetical protein MTR67_052510 [Solanum verrucosum]|uniref:Photosystem I P700 chlorophyll a apoprotein A1 n=1 Tax=Solanum verrucosum TaxID=315347 RepID=A0AAF0V5V9_SOLVR|nr:hypothetical protein MTR67_052510 [Solanum verrucosum]